LRTGIIAAALSTLLLCSCAVHGAGPGTGLSRSTTPPVTPLTQAVSELLRARVELALTVPDVEADGELIHALASVQSLYEARGFRPMWIGPAGPMDLADSLVVYLRGTRREALRPEDYHLEAIQRNLAGARKPGSPGRIVADARLVDLELLLTDAFLLCASHSLSGRLNPETIDPEWFAARRGADFAAIAEHAVSSGRIRDSLQSLLPPQSGYKALRDALAEYRGIARRGGWPSVPMGSALKPREVGERVAYLRARLESSGDIELKEADRDSFDGALEAAVRRFQDRNGLDADGVVGESTLSALNVSAEARAGQIAVNMERWRWLPESLGRTRVMINIAAFTLEAVRDDSLALDMRVIVGRSYRRTPVFSDRITYMVVNPSWEVPDRIAASDVLAQVSKDSTYLQRMGMRVLRGWGGDEMEVDPSTVDWSSVPTAPFPYRFRQSPGPANALGTIKFMFPNRFNVYLHDTPSRGLFAKAVRTFSSGCIRVERPLDLAAFLMRGDVRWSRDRIESTIAAGSEQTIRLPEPVPIHVLYWTAWVDDTGTTQFRDDIYGRDALVRAALAEPPPGAHDAQEF
jgi:murein L,D-transpeptidase YcbB/YkuD